MYSVKSEVGGKFHRLITTRNPRDAWRYAKERAEAIGMTYDVAGDYWVKADGSMRIMVDEEGEWE